LWRGHSQRKSGLRVERAAKLDALHRKAGALPEWLADRVHHEVAIIEADYARKIMEEEFRGHAHPNLKAEEDLFFIDA
jgi:hypothetical protein